MSSVVALNKVCLATKFEYVALSNVGAYQINVLKFGKFLSDRYNATRFLVFFILNSLGHGQPLKFVHKINNSNLVLHTHTLLIVNNNYILIILFQICKDS